MKTYYFADNAHSDAIYGDQLPIGLDITEVSRLSREWDMTTEELLEQMHEATDAEIAEFGVYDSEGAMNKEEKMKYYTADRETGTHIDSFDTYAEAKAAIEQYLANDLVDDPDTYDPNFYDIVDEDHCTIDEDRFFNAPRFVYGKHKTSLQLTEKAFSVYSDTDPLVIIERETENGYRYDLEGVISETNLSADDVNNLLEHLWDE